MTLRSIDESQRIAARVVGFTYLFVSIAASVNELFVRGPLIANIDAAQAAQNVLIFERVFRISVASDLSAFIGDVVLAAAFYMVLKPVNTGIALFGTRVDFARVRRGYRTRCRGDNPSTTTRAFGAQFSPFPTLRRILATSPSH